MTVREIQGYLLELYWLEVSPDLISTVTDAVLETVAEWQNRPLETSYPLVFFDAIRVKIRDEGLVRNKAVYLALGVAADGTKDKPNSACRLRESRDFCADGTIPGEQIEVRLASPS
jgi:putative transposase